MRLPSTRAPFGAPPPIVTPESAPSETPASLRRGHPFLSTFVDIRLAGLPLQRLERAFASALRELNHCDRILSARRPDNDLARLRDALPGTVLEINPLTKRVLCASSALACAYGDTFDPRRSVAPWAPSFDASFRLMPSRRIVVLAPLDLDFGGLAKNHALDRAFAALRRAGVPSFSLNAGDHVRVGGLPASVLLRPPEDDATVLAIGVLRAGAAAGAVPTRRDHPLALRDGGPARRSLGVTVLARSAIDAYALSKVVARAPLDSATSRLLDRRRAYAALTGPGGEIRWLPSPPPAALFTPPAKLPREGSRS